MPDTLPMTESAARPMFAPLDSSLAGLVERYGALKNKPLTRMVVEDAKELDTDAKAFLKQADDSEAARQIKNAYSIHRFLTSMFKKATDPAQEIRRWCSGTLARWEQERRAEADRQRREREEEARKEQERQRIEEAAHLESLGHKEEAEAHLNAPLPPVALPDEKAPSGKVEGFSVITTYKLDQIIDYKAFYHWLAEQPAYWEFMEPKEGKWKRALTDAKGKLVVPGITMKASDETRNRG